MTHDANRLPLLESLILSSPEPLAAGKIMEVLPDMTLEQIEETVTALNEKYLQSEMSFRIRKIAGGYQTYVLEDYTGYVDELFTRRLSVRLSRAALEALAIISYRQPVTKADIELIRGVASDSALHTLLERKLITLSGRASTLGRPLLYSTTPEFLKFFGLNSLEDLPRMEEIEEILAAAEPDRQEALPLETSPQIKPVNEIAQGDIYLARPTPTAEEEFDNDDQGISAEDQHLADLVDSAVDAALAEASLADKELTEKSEDSEIGEILSASDNEDEITADEEGEEFIGVTETSDNTEKEDEIV